MRKLLGILLIIVSAIIVVGTVIETKVPATTGLGITAFIALILSSMVFGFGVTKLIAGEGELTPTILSGVNGMLSGATCFLILLRHMPNGLWAGALATILILIQVILMYVLSLHRKE